MSDSENQLRIENMVLLREVDKWRGLATMMSHFDVCRSARIECNICTEARQAYVRALTA